MTDPKLTLDPAHVEEIFTELGKLAVALDADPLVYGPKRLNAKVAECRAMLSRCETLFLNISQLRHRFHRAFRVASTDLELSKKILYDTDPSVRAGPSQIDRDAIATGKLMSKVKEVHQLELAVSDLDAVLVVIRAKRADLKDAEGRLRDQIRLCSEEIHLGSVWGSRVPGAPELEPGQGRATGADVDAIDDLIAKLQGLEGEIHLQPLPEGKSLIRDRPSIGTFSSGDKPKVEAGDDKPKVEEASAGSERAEKVLANSATKAEIDSFLESNVGAVLSKTESDDDDVQDIIDSLLDS